MLNPQEQTYPGNFYAPIGDFLREEYLQYSFTQGTRQEVDFLLDLLQLPNGARILDVGCGPGRHSLELARRGFVTVGIDISAGLIEVAQRAAQEEDLQAEFYVGDARELEFAPEFDAAICLCEGAFGWPATEDNHRRVLAGIHGAPPTRRLFVLTAVHAPSLVRAPHFQADEFDAFVADAATSARQSETAGVKRARLTSHDRVHLPRVKWLLQDGRFALEAVYGSTAGQFERKPLTLDDFDIMTVARRL
jgi:SAM-dependent methyltransferase